MHASLVRIGNSQGVRLPKAVIEQAGLHGDLELEVVNGAVVIRAQHATRSGWDEAASLCHKKVDDQLDDWDNANADFDGSW